MKSSFDLKHNIGKITPENLDDVWILKDIIKPGDIVRAKTLRSMEIRRGTEKIKTGKKFVTLTIEVEKIEARENQLRLGGKILEGPENVERGHHSIEVVPRLFLRIGRVWRSWEIDRIKAAQRKPIPVLICLLDERDADFYFLRDRHKFLFSIRGGTGKQYREKTDYYADLLKQVKRKSRSVKKIVISGPGFAKENLQKLINEREKELLEKIIVYTTNHIGDVGLQELFKQGLLEKVTKISRVTKETQAVEKLIEKLEKEKAVFGEKVKDHLETGAVSLLLISVDKIKDYENILDLAEKMKVEIMVISDEHQSGEKLLRMGGIGGLLRYKI